MSPIHKLNSYDLRAFLMRLRRTAFVHLMFLYALLDIVGIAITIWWTVPATDAGSEVGILGLVCLYVRWALGLFNETFLVFFAHQYSNTIFGTIFYQQCVYFPLVTYVTAIAFWRTLGISSPWHLANLFMLIRGILDLVVWVALSVCFFRLQGAENKRSAAWAAQVEEITRGVYSITYQPITWRGIRRRRRDFPDLPRNIRVVKSFIRNALFRRVRPVEKKSQAIWMHLFALAAILLILIRTVILLVQLGNEDLPSRTLVQPCEFDGRANETLLYVRYPEYQEDPAEMSRGWGTRNRYNVGFIYQQVEYTDINRTAYAVSSYPCENHRIGSYLVHRCRYSETTQSSVEANRTATRLGFVYTITSPETNRSRHRVLPSIWLAKGDRFWDDLTPRLVPPFQPAPGFHTVFETNYSKRKFISSPALFDAIFDSKPIYTTIDLYTWYRQSGPHARRLDEPLDGLNISDPQVISTGFIQWPSSIKLSPQISRNHLEGGEPEPANLCEVTEEYRTGSTFDILASIGGLFALFQGLHVFLFGRPLFWGLFGAKLITPFGFIGQFAGKDFKQRLREYYHRPNDPESAFNSGTNISREEENIHMTRFLLDYVIDLGPASVTPRVDRRGDVESNIPERGPLLNESQEGTEPVEMTTLPPSSTPDPRER